MIKAASFAALFFLFSYMSLWLGAKYLASVKMPARWCAVAVLLISLWLSSTLAYLMIYHRPIEAEECIEYTPNGSGLC